MTPVHQQRNTTLVRVFQEPTGKLSSTRIFGAGIVIAVIVVMFGAMYKGQWEMARSLAFELLIYSGALMGINRAGRASEAKSAASIEVAKATTTDGGSRP